MVYTTEYGNNCVSVFTCGSKFLTSFGAERTGPGQLMNPYGLTMDKSGVVYVADTGNNRL